MKLGGLQLLCFVIISGLASSLPDGDLCRWMNGRKYYIDVGESGIISVDNATQTGDESQPQIPQRCSVELITCPSCHLEIVIQKLDIPTCSNDNTCRCDFLWIKESAYSKSGREYCGQEQNGSLNLIFESKTKLVSVDFLYSGSYKEAFSLQFTAKKNIYVYKGGYDYYQTNTSGSIKSPNFPGGYPSDYSAEFILQNVDATGFVQLIFADFQLSLWSYVEIFDSNGTRIDVYNGNTFRPPAIISSGPTLTVKFQANDEYPSTGFQAKYTFVSFPEKYWLDRPSTDCGGFVEDSGGAITMMNLVPSKSIRSFDCIWLIRPRNAHVPETHVSIRVAQFEDMGPKSTLFIRQGQHSDAPLLDSVTTLQHHKLPRGKEFVVPATSGFYIRLIGYFSNRSHLAIIYTTFKFNSCFALTDFECTNGRCIKNVLRCDGFNHCGDGSDEAACYGINPRTPIPEDLNWWRTLTPNYYFPKTESSSGTNTNHLILVTSLAGLGMFLLTTVIIFVKLHRQRNDDTISREILQTISADLEAMENSHNQHDRSDLPLYDPPPSYDDVVKLSLPPPPPYSAIGRGQARPSRSRGVDNRGYRNDSDKGSRSHRRPPRNNHRIDTHNSLILKVNLPDETQRTHESSLGTRMDGNSNLPSLLEQEHIFSEEIEAIEASKLGKNVDTNSEKCPLSKLVKNSSPSGVDSEVSCDCEGACSCQLIGKVSRCSSDTRNGRSNFPLPNSEQNSNEIRDIPCAIMPHPKSMIITVHSPKLKKDEIVNRKSIDSPSSSDSERQSPNLTKPKTTESKAPFTSSGHRRSSSGPSLNYLTELSPEQIGKPSPKPVSDNQASSEVMALNQVKYLASILLSGLQQSFFKTGDSASALQDNCDDKAIVPLPSTNHQEPDKNRPEQSEHPSTSNEHWTNHLALKRKRSEQSDSKSKEDKSSWNGSDTLPLLVETSQQPTIVRFDSPSAFQGSPSRLGSVQVDSG